MEGEVRRGADAAADNASLGYMLTVGVMEEVLEKLKLLDYETDFCKQMGFRPLSRFEFFYICAIYIFLAKFNTRYICNRRF